MAVFPTKQKKNKKKAPATLYKGKRRALAGDVGAPLSGSTSLLAIHHGSYRSPLVGVASEGDFWPKVLCKPVSRCA
jgi:hypothetical protein